MGLGNTLNKDEGLGVHALALLEIKLAARAPEVEFLDGGALGLNLLPWVEEASHLLVLDSMVSRFTLPGQVMELAKDEIPLYRNIKMSDHQITFQEVLGLAKFRECFPEHLHLVGAHPVDLSIGYGLSPEIEGVIPEILRRAERVLAEWGLLA
jgi:hydrogenase maturation protease